MPLFDYTQAELEAYRPDRDEPADFDAFWAKTLAQVAEHPIGATFTPYDAKLTTVDVFDVEFAGFGGDPVRGWFLIPHGTTTPLPCVVQYIGYSGGRGFPHDSLVHSAAGRAHLIMDSRGHPGSDTPDRDPYATGPAAFGYMTRGFGSPEQYYYRRIMSDAVRAVEAARSHPLVDADRVVVAGGSQGGGLALAAAGLSEGLAGALVDVPFLCHYRRALDIADRGPYVEITGFLNRRRDQTERVLATLAYFDGMNFAARATAPALFSVGLEDHTCPPSTVYAAYNHYGGRKDLRVWRFNDHEGGGSYQTAEQLKFLADLLG